MIKGTGVIGWFGKPSLPTFTPHQSEVPLALALRLPELATMATMIAVFGVDHPSRDEADTPIIYAASCAKCSDDGQ